MNRIQGLGSYARSIGMSAIVAIVAITAIALASPANSASDYLLELDGVEGEISTKTNELDKKVEDLKLQLDSISSAHSGLAALINEIETLSGEIDALRKAGGEQKEYLRQQIEDSRKVFEDQVAPFLDPDVAEAVRLNYGKITYTYTESDQSDASGAASSELDAPLDNFQQSLRTITDGWEMLQAISTEIQAAVAVLKTKTKSNQSND